MPEFDSSLVAAQLRLLWQIVVAMALGSVIGLDREATDKPAGLRTHMLVAGAAALLVGVGPLVVARVGIDGEFLRSDPLRLLEAIVTGVSFLGAGTIIRGRGGDVRGLTTAASILLCAGVGVAVALSQWVLAVGITVMVVITLSGIGYLERRWRRAG